MDYNERGERRGQWPDTLPAGADQTVGSGRRRNGVGDVEQLVLHCAASIPNPADRESIIAAVRKIAFERDYLADILCVVRAVVIDAGEGSDDRQDSPPTRGRQALRVDQPVPVDVARAR